MKPENIIIAMAFLLVISAFSFNFEKITGFQVSDALLKVPQAGIVNDVIKAGQPIQLRVKINDYCVDPKVEFYKNNIRKSHTTYRPTEDECQGQNFYPCRGSKYCQGDLIADTMVLDYYTLPSWKVSPGIYMARVHYIERVGQKEHDTSYIEVPFRISE